MVSEPQKSIWNCAQGRDQQRKKQKRNHDGYDGRPREEGYVSDAHWGLNDAACEWSYCAGIGRGQVFLLVLISARSEGSL